MTSSGPLGGDVADSDGFTDVAELDLVPVGTPIDLDNCAREPIHVPGSIQPRGVLIVAQEPDLTVIQVSANIADLLRVAPQDALGRPLGEVIGRQQADTIARASAGFGDLRERNPVETDIHVGGNEGLPATDVAFDAILHRESGNLLLIELELATGPRPFSFPNTYLSVRGAVAELNRATSLVELYDITARAVRELTGFDRVMVYRYDHEYNGEVVAENKREDLNSFLGQHYPASDIPAQARALYEKNWVRLIDDIDYTPSPLVPVDNPVTGRPLDLTHSTLRSVSPIHVEYLQNMGVGASMSISLLRDGSLWGLIACHHYSGAHLPPYGVRAAAEFLGSTLSLRLVDRVEDEALRARLASQAVLAKLSAALQTPNESIVNSLLGAPDLFDLVEADGVAVSIEGRTEVRGTVPARNQLDDLAAWMTRECVDQLATDSLTRSAPSLDIDPHDVSGVLGLVLREDQWVMWFRSEVERSVDWGGDPHNKAIAVQQGDSVRLSPRKSFDRWREVVKGRSLPWTDIERNDAGTLRQRIVEALYARSEREIALAETLQRSLLPEMPAVAGWDLSARYEPAAGGRIGGDWYDAFRLQDGQIVLVVGDVAGHGIGAAGTMSQLRNALRAYLIDGVSPAGAVERLNEFTSLLPGAFATLALACLDPASGEVAAVIAGHPRPLVLHPDGTVDEAPFTTSPPIGVPGVDYGVAEYTLAPQDSLVFFTDGLVERRDEDMADSLQYLTAELGRLGDEPNASKVFRASLRRASTDDTTVLVARRLA